MAVTTLAFIFVFGLLVIFHETGHFAAAKLVGIRVEEFCIGFGPKIIGAKRGETFYSVRLLPLGGFVKMTGEEGDSDVNDERSFMNKSVLSRLAVIGAGPFMNFVLAVILFAALFFIIGVPESNPLIGEVLTGSPADVAGLQTGDRVVAVAGEKVDTWEDMVAAIRSSPIESIPFQIERQGNILQLELTPKVNAETGTTYIGIQRVIYRHSFFLAWAQGFKQSVRLVTFIGRQLLSMVTGQITPDVAGPVGIYQVIGEVARTGFLNLISLAAVLSVNLALFNLFPIPMLDGGQLVFLSIEAIRGRPLAPEQEGFLKFIGILLLMFLLVTVTFRDVTRLVL